MTAIRFRPDYRGRKHEETGMYDDNFWRFRPDYRGRKQKALAEHEAKEAQGLDPTIGDGN